MYSSNYECTNSLLTAFTHQFSSYAKLNAKKSKTKSLTQLKC